MRDRIGTKLIMMLYNVTPHLPAKSKVIILINKISSPNIEYIIV